QGGGLRDPRRRGVRAGGRVRFREDHHRSRHRRARTHHRRQPQRARPRDARDAGEDVHTAVPTDRLRVPGPGDLLQPAPDHRAVHRRAADRARAAAQPRRTGPARAGPARSGRAARQVRGAVSARALRRAASAHLPGPGARARARAADRGRAHQRPGRLRAGDRAGPVPGPAVPSRLRRAVHQPRPRRRRLPRPPHRGAVPRRPGRGRPRPGRAAGPAARVHAQADRLAAGAGPGRTGAAPPGVHRPVGRGGGELMQGACSGTPATPQDGIVRGELGFREDGTFTVVQFNDTQDGPRTDRRTIALQDAVLEDVRPDVVVLNGDVIDGSPRTAGEAKQALNNVVRPMEDRGIPWALTFGNHDEDSTARTGLDEAGYVDVVRQYAHNVNTAGADGVTGTGNQVLTVRSASAPRDAFALWLIDSGRYAPEQIAGQGFEGYPDW